MAKHTARRMRGNVVDVTEDFFSESILKFPEDNYIPRGFEKQIREDKITRGYKLTAKPRRGSR